MNMNNVEGGSASIEEGSKMVLLGLSLLCYEVEDGMPLNHQILPTSPWSGAEIYVFLIDQKNKTFLKIEDT